MYKINSSHKFSVKPPWTGCQSRPVTNLDVLFWRHFVKIPLKQGVFFGAGFYPMRSQRYDMRYANF